MPWYWRVVILSAEFYQEIATRPIPTDL